ncbi:MAG: hypothetical protein DWQ05_07415 [Calditrichaeota bacterium]|nr:MAG: hypothetical protein DWQ05_07415 [Calditrichota bacterium]
MQRPKNKFFVRIISLIVLFSFCAHMGEHILFNIMEAASSNNNCIEAESGTSPVSDNEAHLHPKGPFQPSNTFDLHNSSQSASHDHQYKCCTLNHTFSVPAPHNWVLGSTNFYLLAEFSQAIHFNTFENSLYLATYFPDIFHPPAS